MSPRGTRFALLVGINAYTDPSFPSLRFCVNDVLELERTLRSVGYVVVSLHYRATEPRLLPTRDNVEAELMRLCEIVRAPDTLVIHFACHGQLIEDKPVLVTSELRRETLAERALPLHLVEQKMRGSQARKQVLILDACHVGVEVGREIGLPGFNRNVYDLAQGFALLAGSTAQQVAQEWESRQHGVFTYYLLEALRGAADRAGKGFVTVDDIKDHVLDRLRTWNVEHGGLLQEPTARTEGMGDIVIAEVSQRQEAAPAPVSRITHREPVAMRLLGDPAFVVRTTSPEKAVALERIAPPLHPGMRPMSIPQRALPRIESETSFPPDFKLESYLITGPSAPLLDYYRAEFGRMGWSDMTDLGVTMLGKEKEMAQLMQAGGGQLSFVNTSDGTSVSVFVFPAIVVRLSGWLDLAPGESLVRVMCSCLG